MFVTSPKGSAFSKELNKILDYYVVKSLKYSVIMEKEIYDKVLYNKIIPFSVLCTEL